MAKSWDCNGKFFVFTDYNGKFYSYPLNADGKFDDNNLSAWMLATTTGIINMGEMFNYHKTLMEQYDFLWDEAYGNTSASFLIANPTGIRLFHDTYMFYSAAGNFKTAYNWYSLKYNTIGTARCVSDSTTSGVTSLLYLANNGAPEWADAYQYGIIHQPSAFTVSLPQFNTASLNSQISVNFLLNTYNRYAPYEDNYQKVGGGPAPRSSFGFSTPVVVGDKIHIAHCGGNAQFSVTSSIYSFDFNGRSLSFGNPNIHTAYSDYNVCSMFYNGQSHYKLLSKNVYKADYNWESNALHIVKH